jgi:hypothetical protein
MLSSGYLFFIRLALSLVEFAFCLRLCARYLEQFSEVVFAQHSAFAYPQAFACVKKLVFLVRCNLELKRVEPADQGSQGVNGAPILFQKDTFSVFRGLSHLVTIRCLVFNSFRERGNRLRSCQGNLFNLFAQNKNMPSLFPRVAAADSTLYASKAYRNRILKTHFGLQQNTVLTRTPIKTPMVFFFWFP